jgi:hypothetical protein
MRVAVVSVQLSAAAAKVALVPVLAARVALVPGRRLRRVSLRSLGDEYRFGTASCRRICRLFSVGALVIDIGVCPVSRIVEELKHGSSRVNHL